MKTAYAITELENTRDYFSRSTRVFAEADSRFAPADGIFTVAQQVAHAAQTVLWYLDGVFTGKGWNMDFEQHEREARAVASLAVARGQFDDAFEKLIETVRGLPEGSLEERLPADDIVLPGLPRSSIVLGIVDHTAHHRGALTIYARMLGKQPAMPYMEISE